MPKQFLRDYELTIVPQEEDTRVITDLKITFEITKSVLSYPNLARIVIYNPAPKTISALQRKFTKVSLKAGYEGNIKLIFKGDVRNVYQGKTSTDRTITILAGDGEQDWKNSRFNKTFSASVATADIIKEVISSFENLTEGVIQNLPEGNDKLLGSTLSGSSKDLLDMYAKEYGFNWSIQDEEIRVVGFDKIIQDDEAVLITAATGMLGTPIVTEIGADVSTLLNPELLPDKLFKIESVNAEFQLGNINFRDIKRTDATGFYKVMEVNFRGDSRDGDWVSFVKGRSLNGRSS